MRIAIIGGGPAGDGAALVAAELGGEVHLINDEGLGGNSVLWDCVPSKTLISSAVAYNSLKVAPELGVRLHDGADGGRSAEVDFPQVLRRVRGLADAQSRDIADKVVKDGAQIVLGHAELIDPHTVEVTSPDGDRERLPVDAVLVAPGSAPRKLDTAPTDGEVVLSSRDLYGLERLPERLVVIGSGATGAEYAGAFGEFGVDVT